MSDTLQVLIKARELVARPGGWCQGLYLEGEAVCAVGAIIAAAERRIPIEKAAESFLLDAIKPPFTITAWNDDPWRTQAEVVAAFDRAIEAARKEQT